MIPAPIPENDQQRVAALHALLILDTPPEERFDRIVAFAATELEMPTVLVSLVDADRQWFKSSIGMDVCETPRSISFCGHAIAGRDIFIVPDTRADARFADNPLVAGAPFIRFYAGAPLILSSGHAVGTFCVLDTKTRVLDPIELFIMSDLRNLIVNELEASKTNTA
ncbi:GAF domain-containing protein [Massilia glaciei]|uniref:Histidine kinase n=1 Tax=Massilia glaciei TaxID=1524097 RepID=A0A2U2HNF9_9BURK|nr:GAF domain-containing protein [Massilia glaciei]PWF49040.1 histidine kinase [Massilia glaciei]